MAQETPRLATEIAHILFMDLVGYSLHSMEELARLSRELRDIVRETPEFKRSEGDENLMLSLDMGDGMALVFFRDPIAPVQCAVEIARALQTRPHLQLRIGIHSGPVSRVQDINSKQNVAGSGINTAQRVMDAGDAGYILVSNSTAEVLLQFESWSNCLIDLGLCEVKHGKMIHLFNLYMDEIGHAEPPARLRANWKPETREQGSVGNREQGIGNRTPNTQYPTPNTEYLNTRRPEDLKSRIPNTEPPASSRQPPTTSHQPLPATGKRIALLYKRNAPDDERLLTLIEAELRARGYHVFIDRHMAVGLEWASELTKQVSGSDAVIPLLSAESVKSDMLAWEVDMAHKAAQSQNGKPRILPVRVRYQEALPAPLAVILDPIMYTLWEGEQDDVRVVTDIVHALEIAQPMQPTVPRERLEPIGGAVPLDSKFYIVRPTDHEFKAAIARQDSIVLVKGARQMGKTSLLARGLQQAREAGARVVLTDFQTLNAAHLTSAETLFLTLAEMIADQLDLDVSPSETWSSARGPNMNLERFLRHDILGAIPEPIVWGLDEVDRLFTCDFGSEVFGLFRSWHNRRSLDPTGPWSRLTLAIAYATEAHLFITDLNQSPFNVGTRLALEDFSIEQVGELNQRYGVPLRTNDELARFYRLLSGQPYLVRRGLDEMATQGLAIAGFEAQADRDEGLFGDHLRRILVSLSQDTEMIEVVRAILRGEPCPTAESFYRLRSAGLMVGDSAQNARFRCQLYATYLARHLL